MANVHPQVVCANPECRVTETGRCVEGLKLETCPRYGHEVIEAGEADAGDFEERLENKEKSIALPKAQTLKTAEASSLLRAGDGRVVAILGPAASGKTSLIASLYDLFQEGPVVGIEFSGSRTLHAFEETCHDARMASRRGEPHMIRTPRGEVRFYHLEIGGGIAGDSLALILGDRAGEEYREAADDASIATAFLEVDRADSLTVLVDGERLLDAGARHNVLGETKLMLQALRDGGALRLGSRLALVLTKLDTVQDSIYAERATRDFDRLSVDVRRLFGDVLSTVERFEIAASPKTGALQRGTGIPELLSFWLRPAVAPTSPPRPAPQFVRAFARVLPLDECAE
jgi:Double-GTPase 2